MVFASQKGLVELENVEGWMSSVPRVLCMLEPDRMVSFEVGVRPLLVTSGG